ncbi:MerC domain-containing protein [Sphingoaurantiacus capsulatus]|uniref:MerC domain-containing protein n=1 Tax=Sphingoaurantiacus capsulatus TaxID=1771310 RepID=A0ABV7XCU3_9SPHN
MRHYNKRGMDFRWIDRSAMGLSGLCLVHCLVGSLLLAAVSVSGGFLWNHAFHIVGLAFAIPLAAFALWRGVVKHGRWLVAAVGGLGLGAMTAAQFAVHGAAAEIFYTVVGVSLLGVAHLLNLRWSA